MYMFHIKAYDIILLQECHSTKQVEHLWKGIWGGKIWFDHASSKEKGVAILFRKNFNLRLKK